MRKTKLFFFALLVSVAAGAQPSNDDCDNPIILPQALNYCSPVEGFSNEGATPSSYGAPSCFTTVNKDVWFSFTPQATDVTITVRGFTPLSPGGSLLRPQVTLYYGTCGGTINEQECASGTSGIVELYKGGLYVGATYLIRVQGLNNFEGTFQLCFNNYNPPVEPSSDCPTASILCDKSSFVVQSVVGAGNDKKELDDADCFTGGSLGNNETNSTWFVWTCDKSGPLEFTLTPLNATDDLDFVLYRLPNGIGNCSGKQPVRCMASGDFTFPSPCMGPTGLQAGDPDTNEDPGCTNNGDDAWLAPFDMVAGESYALAVNNFTSTGNGFSIEFGGAGTFLGPTAQFTVNPSAICLGLPVQISDASSFVLGSISSWQWTFGDDAIPQIANGPGPHEVVFLKSGPQSIVLTIQTNLGCIVTTIQQISIYPGVVVDTVIAAPDCNGATNGGIELANITQGTRPFQFSWEGGPFTPDSTYTGVGVGVYNVLVRDANNCETTLDIPVSERVMTVDADPENPLCFGDANGVITLNPTNGVGPFLFDWGNGFIPSNSQGGFAPGTYTINGIDATLCKGTFVVTVGENPPVTIQLDTTDLSCFGADDGTATAIGGGGVGNFSYLWSNSQTASIASGLAPGAYAVTASDGNGCSITGSVFVQEPPDLTLALLDVVNLLCNSLPTGQIRVEGGGGMPGYTFSADGNIFQNSDTLTGLSAGDYHVYIMDANGCIDSIDATIIQPPPLLIFAYPADTTLNLGYSIDLNTIVSPPGRRVTYSWTPALGLSCIGGSPQGVIDCAEPTLQAVNDMVYVVTIIDDDGCEASDTVRVLVNKNRPIYIPNVFKPEGNFENSRFTFFGNPGAQSIELLQIYDRWGSLIWEGQDLVPGDLNQGWDGTYKDKIVEGVFTFLGNVRFVDGVLGEYKGDVTVLR